MQIETGTGNWLECLSDYLKSITWESKETTTFCKPIMDFVGVGQSAVRRWYVGEVKPAGLTLVKVRYFLQKMGYKVLELESLEQPYYDIGLLITHGKLDISSVVEKLDFTTPNELFNVLHNKGGFSKEKFDLLGTVLEDYKEELENIKNGVVDKEYTTAGKSFVDSDRNNGYEIIVNLFDALQGVQEALRIHLNHIVGSDVSAKERQDFRSKYGTKVFNLSNQTFNLAKLLSSLCSETSRNSNNNIRGGQK